MPLASPFASEPLDFLQFPSTATTSAPQHTLSKTNQTQKMTDLASRTNQVAEDLDYLQDQLLDVASFVGLDSDQFINYNGSEQEREALYSLIDPTPDTRDLPLLAPHLEELPPSGQIENCGPLGVVRVM